MQERILKDIKDIRPLDLARTDKRVLAEERDAMLKDSPEELQLAVAKIRQLLPVDGRIVFVSGNFNVVHPDADLYISYSLLS